MRAIRILLAAVVTLVLAAAPALAHAPGKGSYRVKWRALSDDGHHESGSWTFKVS